MDEDDSAAQRADLEQMHREAMDALLKARTLGLSETECMGIAYAAGIANDFYKETHK